MLRVSIAFNRAQENIILVYLYKETGILIIFVACEKNG